MELSGLRGTMADSWAQMTAVDALMDAIDCADAAQIRALAASPAVRAALGGEPRTRLEVIACLARSGCTELEAEARAVVAAEPALATARLGAGQTLLHRGASAWRAPFCEVLLELGARPDEVDAAGHPPLYYAGNAFPRPAGAPADAAAAITALFCRHGADLDRAQGVKRCTPLHMAARRGHADLAEALVRHGANIEARDSNGETPLRRAVNCGHCDVARTLLLLGADPASRCNRGRSPAEAARTDAMRHLFA